jgi:hypothetical protein
MRWTRVNKGAQQSSRRWVCYRVPVNKRPLPALLLVPLVVFIAGSPSCSSNSGPSPNLTVVKATDLGAIPKNPDILGRDGAYSTLFQGYSVWLYGDTFLAKPNAENRTLISDSWSYTTDLNAQNGIAGFEERLDPAGAPAMILTETPAEQTFNQAHNGNPCQQQPCGVRWALWPSSIVTDPASNHALVFYMVVYAQPGSFNFQGMGESVALWQDFQQQPQRPTFSPSLVPNHPDLMFNENEPAFGTAAFVSNGMLYVFGCGMPSNGTNKGCRLAKVDPASVQNRNAWRFYAGNGNWSSQDTDAVSLFTGGNIMSVSWNGYLGSYVAVYSPTFSQNVMLRTSLAPEGPWSAEIVAFVAMQPVSGNVYDAHAHPEYEAGGGQTMYVTYSRATGTFTSEVRLVRVELEAAGSRRPSVAWRLSLSHHPFPDMDCVYCLW